MYCPNCGGEVTEGSLFCGECGCRLQEMDMGKPEKVEKPEDKIYEGNNVPVNAVDDSGRWGEKESKEEKGDRRDNEKTKKNSPLRKAAKIAAEIVGIAGCILFVLGITGKLDKIGEELGKTEIFGGELYKGVTVGDAIDNIIAYYTKGEAGSKNEPNVNKPDVDAPDVNDPAAENSTGQKDASAYQKEGGMGNTQPTEESNSALDAIASAIAEPGTMESGTQGTDSAYAMEWDGYYARDKGPGSGILIWSADESGVDFAAGIGSSGYLAYRDLRDCHAQWVSDQTAVFEGGYGGRIELHFNEDGTLSVEEEGIDTDEMLSLTGLYVNTDNAASAANADLSGAEFVLKNSDSQTLSEEDLEGLTPLECKIARNEIYARYGRMFKDEQLQNYFESCSWYEGRIPANEFTEDILNSVEKENANIISAYEEKMKYK